MSAARELLVVGSGASAVHFAQSALEAGARVRMLDVGRPAPPAVEPERGFRELRGALDDPYAWLLGDGLEGAVLPDFGREYYGFPPSKRYVFEPVAGADVRARGFEVLASFARGGLAQAWTGGVYPYRDAELEEWPVGAAELAPFYDLVAARIGVSGAVDDLAPFLPGHAHLQPPLELDAHSRALLERYERRRARLNARGVYMGRSRVATLSRDHEGRPACAQLGRCLWGCPTESLYTPSVTLARLQRGERFTYLPGRLATRMELDDAGRARAVVCRRLDGGAEERHEAEAVVLAAGTLSSARLLLASLRRAGGSAPRLTGLMDNRQVLVPFVNLRRLGAAWEPESYQYHLLNLSLDAPRAAEYVHGQVTTLGTALIHPIAQGVPADLRSALALFRRLHGALGLLNVNLHDARREGCFLELDGDSLVAEYAPPEGEPARLKAVLKRYRRALRALGCVVPPGMTHVRPMGASVHYAGTLPMTREARPLTLDADCRSRDVANLWVVDGSGFPSLPAKNPTFTLMANAARAAARMA